MTEAGSPDANTSQKSDTDETSDTPAGPGSDPPVHATISRPDRTVFTEEGNTDGWIASDLVLSVER